MHQCNNTVNAPVQYFFHRAIKNPHKAGWGRAQKSPRWAGLIDISRFLNLSPRGLGYLASNRISFPKVRNARF